MSAGTSSVHLTAVSPSTVPTCNRCVVNISPVSEGMNQPRISLPSTREEPLAECGKEVVPGSGCSLPFHYGPSRIESQVGSSPVRFSWILPDCLLSPGEAPLNDLYMWALLESLFLLEFDCKDPFLNIICCSLKSPGFPPVSKYIDHRFPHVTQVAQLVWCHFKTWGTGVFMKEKKCNIQ